MIKQADFNMWRGEHSGRSCLEPRSKLGKAWIATNLEGPATDAKVFLVETATVESLICRIEADDLVVAYGKPAY